MEKWLSAEGGVEEYMVKTMRAEVKRGCGFSGSVVGPVGSCLSLDMQIGCWLRVFLSFVKMPRWSHLDSDGE